jgi:hypothetical protein
MDIEARDYVEAEFNEIILGLYALLGHAYWINNPFSSRIAHRKLLQLRTAVEVGFKVPKSPGAPEITHLSDLTRAGNPHEAGGDPAVLSNTLPPLPLAGRPSKTWADVFLPHR